MSLGRTGFSAPEYGGSQGTGNFDTGILVSSVKDAPLAQFFSTQQSMSKNPTAIAILGIQVKKEEASIHMKAEMAIFAGMKYDRQMVMLNNDNLMRKSKRVKKALTEP
ncbi:hypothetical protein ARMGADRAFT_1037597 [Armillaria gallica]|uniref:Uncharacterized protein n=1 Tax=Armillaria gallica TaxID=47427 RepID=A0A2H3CL07_ARMGA|nr:hypothetical protein ARMGADRAFT_1037597 [Armillaria gallica]